MEELQQGHTGGIQGLRLYVAEHAEAIAFDLLNMPGAYHLDEIGDRLSWWELKAVIDSLPVESALARKLITARRAEAEAQRIASLPEDERPIGTDAIPFDEMLDWLGWEVEGIGS